MTVSHVQPVEFSEVEFASIKKPGKGDLVILRVSEHVMWEQADRLRKDWEKRFPGTRAVVFGRGLDIVFVRAMRSMVSEDLHTFGDGVHVDFLAR